MLNSAEAMRTFLNLIASEPDIDRVPHRSILPNGPSLKQGLNAFKANPLLIPSPQRRRGFFQEQARKVLYYGAAAIVMAFDENGQADTSKTCRHLQACL